jgi:hypothetical protein
VDISQSGISAMLPVEVPLGCPLETWRLLAMVRQRNAFRYAFQFVDAMAAHPVMGRTCRQLALEESTRGAELLLTRSLAGLHFIQLKGPGRR